MALKRPPQHRVDARPVYVHPGDSGWDENRIEEECKRLRETGQEHSHPVFRYRSGESRYDISGALAYLDTSKAWQFELRPLSMREFAEVQDIRARQGDWTGYLHAAELGLERIIGPGAPHNLEGCAEIDPLFPRLVGQAVWLASQPLTESEKKPSDS